MNSSGAVRGAAGLLSLKQQREAGNRFIVVAGDGGDNRLRARHI
jgi:hypothetical protein